MRFCSSRRTSRRSRAEPRCTLMAGHGPRLAGCGGPRMTGCSRAQVRARLSACSPAPRRRRDLSLSVCARSSYYLVSAAVAAEGDERASRGAARRALGEPTVVALDSPWDPSSRRRSPPSGPRGPPRPRSRRPSRIRPRRHASPSQLSDARACGVGMQPRCRKRAAISASARVSVR
jgi:hypothetical protein